MTHPISTACWLLAPAGARAWTRRARFALAALAVLVFAATPARSATAPLLTPPAAPRFKVQDVQGHTLELAELLRHGPVLLDFWATWCTPCVQALPELEALHRRYGPLGLTVVGVSVDGPRNFAKVRPFVASRGLTFAIVLDRDGRLQQSYQVLAAPTAVLIDTSGAIVQVRTGYRPGEGAKFEDSIRALLPEPKTP